MAINKAETKKKKIPISCFTEKKNYPKIHAESQKILHNQNNPQQNNNEG